MIFGVFEFFQKTNERSLLTTMITVFIRLLEEIKDTKNHFENIWPLERYVFKTKILIVIEKSVSIQLYSFHCFLISVWFGERLMMSERNEPSLITSCCPKKDWGWHINYSHFWYLFPNNVTIKLWSGRQRYWDHFLCCSCSPSQVVITVL